MATEVTSRLITVVLADDHELARQGVRLVLHRDADILVVGEADTSADTVAKIRSLLPDIAILDIRLRQGTGIEVVQAIKAQSLNTKVLILTAYDDPRYFRYLSRLGVSGFLIKTTSSEELVDAVHAVAEGKFVYPKPESFTPYNTFLNGGDFDLLEQNLGDMELGRKKTEKIGGLLTPRETEVLRHVARGMRNAEVAQAMSIALKTVEVHVEHILAKLGARSRTQAVLTALKNGML